MPYGWQVKLDGVDISDVVSRFSIDCSMDSFCREMTLDIMDADLYDGLDFTVLSDAAEIEILTRTGASYVSQGKFFVERPRIAHTVREDMMQGVWGRSATAALAEPFAPKVTRVWEEKTTFFAICEEMCDLVGFTWNSAYAEIIDFTIYPYTYEADGLYPIDVIAELAALGGCVATTDAGGHLCILPVNYAPTVADATVTDDDIASLSEDAEWPVFGNRLRIAPTGSLASYALNLIIPDPCLQQNTSHKAKMYAQVTDPSGEPVDGIVVDWSSDAAAASLVYAATNTQAILVQNEQVRADSFYELTLSLPPDSVDSIYAYSDAGRAVDLSSGGYTVSGNGVTLTNKLTYCDQLLVVNYRVRGVAVNYLTAGSAAEDVTVTADVEDQQDTGVVYVGNPCECPPSIRLTASPAAIAIHEISQLLVYVEDSGPVTNGRMVFMAETSAFRRGYLRWTSARLGIVAVTGEETVARNEVAGVTRCETEMFIASVTWVKRMGDDGEPVGADLYDSHDGKVIDLVSAVATGTALLVSYRAQGAALNLFTGIAVGEARLMAYIRTSREAGSEAYAAVRVEDDAEVSDDSPPDWSPGDLDGGYGGPGGTDDDPDDPDGGGSRYVDSPDAFDTDSVLCHKSDGSVETCEDGTLCCIGPGNTVGCFSPEICNRCLPANVSDGPTEEALGGRFDDALAAGCTCEEICRLEHDVFGTNQGYDDASGKTISQMVIDEGYEPGEPDYWDKYNEYYEEALQECIEACEEHSCAAAVLNYTTLQMGAGEHQTLYVTGHPDGSAITWRLEGGGSLNTTEGASVLFTSAASNADCDGNAEVSAFCNGELIDTITIAVNTSTSTAVAYYKLEINTVEGPTWCDANAYSKSYGCDGSLKSSYACTGCSAGYTPGCPSCNAGTMTSRCQAGSPWASFGGCSILSANGACANGAVVDVRTTTMIAEGCCPEALM